MKSTRPLNLLRILLLGTLLLSVFAFIQFVTPAYEAGTLFTARRWVMASGFGLLGVMAGAAVLAATWSPRWEQMARLYSRGFDFFTSLRAANLVLFALLAGVYAYLTIGRFSHIFDNPTIRIFLFWIFVLPGSFLLFAAGWRRSFFELLASSALLMMLVFRIAFYSTEISTYPFSLSWSEASRYYYASLYFAERIYDLSLPPTVLHPSRYLMQAVPFLLPDSSLWLHRVWQVILWIVTTLLTSTLLARRLAIRDRLRFWVFSAWAFLFLLIGPVYYHLQVPLILVLWGFGNKDEPEKKRFWKSFGIVILASAWAGISRINWFPVPAMLAAALYFVDEPVRGQSILRYLVKPFIWGAAGMLTAFASQTLYALISGNPAEQFASSLASDLLWYRLFPNPTYPPGILLASLLVILPLLLLIGIKAGAILRSVHPIRWLGLLAILLILYVGGVIVSTKIGGGSNLHNLDAFLALLMVIGGSIFFERLVSEPAHEAERTDPEAVGSAGKAARNPSLYAWSYRGALALTLLVPILHFLPSRYFASYPPPDQTQTALNTLADFVEDTARDGEVLLIAERQLLTFNELDDVKLVPEYEQVFLMEMAMAGNPSYLGKFREDLKNHRFAMIVSEPLFTAEKGPTESFGEENNAWVKEVSKEILCYYQPRKKLRDVRIYLYVPRANSQNCP